MLSQVSQTTGKGLKPCASYLSHFAFLPLPRPPSPPPKIKQGKKRQRKGKQEPIECVFERKGRNPGKWLRRNGEGEGKRRDDENR